VQVPAPFEYERATSVDDAVALLERLGPEARIIAGGHSLLPMMKLRLAAPEHLIDINDLAELAYIREDGGEIRIGALTRHRELLESELLAGLLPIFAEAERTVADPVVRNRGTVVGNLTHADPQGDWATVMMCLDGEVVARSTEGERVIPVSQFITGPFSTTLMPNEIAVEVRVPGATNFGEYHKIERKVGDFATVAVGVALQQQGGSVSRVGIGLTGVGPSNIKCYDAERIVSGGGLNENTIQQAAQAAAADSSPRTDHRGSEEYKREMVAVFVRRSLHAAAGIRAA
jgi:carbon-monoxide dehydrogenase medium subunit